VTAAQAAVFAYAVVSRLAYAGFVGVALRRQERDAAFTRTGDATAGFRRFRRSAAVLMNNDAVAFILLCVVTPSSFASPVSTGMTVAAGLLLIVLGLGVKLWAARTLGVGAYYWHNFFVPPVSPQPMAAGPYRYTANPMYTIGYLQTYGLALVFRSWPGLVAALISQTAILIMYFAVEKPHFDRLHGR